METTKPKKYCTCENTFSGIFVLERGIEMVALAYWRRENNPPNLGHRVYMCTICNKPSDNSYKRSKKKCPDCWESFVAPWATTCRECHDSTLVYKDWPWVKQLVSDYKNKCLTYFNN